MFLHKAQRLKGHSWEPLSEPEWLAANKNCKGKKESMAKKCFASPAVWTRESQSKWHHWMGQGWRLIPPPPFPEMDELLQMFLLKPDRDSSQKEAAENQGRPRGLTELTKINSSVEANRKLTDLQLFSLQMGEMLNAVLKGRHIQLIPSFCHCYCVHVLLRAELLKRYHLYLGPVL